MKIQVLTHCQLNRICVDIKCDNISSYMTLQCQFVRIRSSDNRSRASDSLISGVGTRLAQTPRNRNFLSQHISTAHSCLVLHVISISGHVRMSSITLLHCEVSGKSFTWQVNIVHIRGRWPVPLIGQQIARANRAKDRSKMRASLGAPDLAAHAFPPRPTAPRRFDFQPTNYCRKDFGPFKLRSTLTRLSQTR